MTTNQKNGFRLMVVGMVLTVICLIAGTGCTFEEVEKLKSTSSPDNEAPSLMGSFTTQHCFLNKFATLGNGVDIYSDATLKLHADGSGKSEFTLYTDSACDNPVMAGEAVLAFEVVRIIGSIAVIQVDQQNDPMDPSNVTRYWMAVLVEQQGLTAELDYTDGTSGPFLSAPTDGDLGAFTADPHGQGSLLRRTGEPE